MLSMCPDCGQPLRDDDSHVDSCPTAGEELGRTVVRARDRQQAEFSIRLIDGREVELDGPVTLGRNPLQDPGGRAVSVDDPDFSVSKTHLRLDPEAGAVWATDLGSTNGARVIQPAGGESWLVPGERTRLWPGCRVHFGTNSFSLAQTAAQTEQREDGTRSRSHVAASQSTGASLIATIPDTFEPPPDAGSAAASPDATCPSCSTPMPVDQGYCTGCTRSGHGGVPTDGPPAPAGPMTTIGDITVTDDGVVLTPAGSAQLRGCVWSVSEYVTERQYIARSTIIWAIVLSVFCGLGLLLLLKKEHEVTGTVDVYVISGELRHRTTIAISDQSGLERVRANVAELQAAGTAA